MEKDFQGWHQVKEKLDLLKNPPTFQEREIWWCSIGMNIGYEMFGKDENFVRPVLILRKHSIFTFFGLPLTSRRKNISSHYHLDFKDEKGSVVLDQGKTFDSRRLIKKMGKIPTQKVEAIRTALKEII